MSWLDVLSAVLLISGGIFFLTGTVGMLRFSSCYSRLHALTKADNAGLGLIALGLMVQAESLWVALKILLVWALALLAATVSAHLIARFSLRVDRGTQRAPP